MHATKCLLIERHGLTCMICGEKTPLENLQYHHIKPKYASKAEGKPADDSYENGSLACVNCHHNIHLYDWGSFEYKQMTAKILENKYKPTS